jgi:hypothetical protein
MFEHDIISSRTDVPAEHASRRRQMQTSIYVAKFFLAVVAQMLQAGDVMIL